MVRDVAVEGAQDLDTKTVGMDGPLTALLLGDTVPLDPLPVPPPGLPPGLHASHGRRRRSAAAPAQRGTPGAVDQATPRDPRPASLPATAHAVNAVVANARMAVDCPSLSLLPSVCPETIYAFLRDHRGLRTRPQGIAPLVLDILAPPVLEAMSLAGRLHQSHPGRPAAFALVTAAPTLLFRPFPPGAAQPAVRIEATRRVSLWRAGRLADLMQEAVTEHAAGQPPAGRRRPADAAPHLAASLVRDGAYGKAAALAQSHGLVEDPAEAERALRALHRPRRAFPDYVPPGRPARTPSAAQVVQAEHVQEAVQRMPKRAATHVDGWRWEHIRDLLNVEEAEPAVLAYVQAVVSADVPADAADFLSSATLWPFLKEDQAAVAAARACAGETTFVPPTRPVAVSSALARLAGASLLAATTPAIRAAVGPSQYCVKTPDGVEAVLFGVRAARESRNLWTLQLDIANAFNEVSRQRIWQQLNADPALAPLIPFFRLMYLDRNGPLWYYPPGHCSPGATLASEEGSRQGCVFGSALFGIGYAPFLRWVDDRCTQGVHQGVQFSFADDTTIVGCPRTLVSIVDDSEQALADLTGLRLNRAKIKTPPPPSRSRWRRPPFRRLLPPSPR